MFTFLDKDNCEGCQDRAEIMGADEWFGDALLIGSLFFFTVIVIYLSK